MNKNKLANLETEQINERTSNLDTMSSEDLVRTLHAENHTVASAIDPALPAIAEAVDKITSRIERGGRIRYVGAGTSGRLGVLDASECPPTFSVSAELVQGVIAGGRDALVASIEGAEDYPEHGAKDLEDQEITELDTVIGIASSGRTPYVVGALKYAQKMGAYAVSIVNVSDSEAERHCDCVIRAITGPEPISGSTRLKAGTAQKMILNMITNSVMVKLGKVYGNLMVDVKPTNSKLKDRAVRIVMKACNISAENARALLEETHWSPKTAIVMNLLDVSQEVAEAKLHEALGHVRRAVGQS